MADFRRTIGELRRQRTVLQSEVSRLGEAIAILEKLRSPHKSAEPRVKARRTLSGSARARIAAAQRARWAKVRKQKAAA